MQAARYNASVLDAEAATERFTRAGRVGVVGCDYTSASSQRSRMEQFADLRLDGMSLVYDRRLPARAALITRVLRLASPNTAPVQHGTRIACPATVKAPVATSERL